MSKPLCEKWFQGFLILSQKFSIEKFLSLKKVMGLNIIHGNLIATWRDSENNTEKFLKIFGMSLTDKFK